MTRKPRIAHVTTSHFPDDVRIYEKECRSLSTSGLYEVFLVAPGQNSTESSVSHLSFGKRPTTRPQRFILGPLRTQALVRTLKFDIWHFHDPELLPVAIHLAKIGGSVIWDAHEDYVSQFTKNGAKSWIPEILLPNAEKGMQWLLSSIDHHATAIVAATPTIAERYSNERTVVVGNETKLEDFIACSPSFQSRQILFTGSLTQNHCFFDVVRAIEKLPDFTLAIAGRDQTSAGWQFAQATLGPRVSHLGWLDRGGLANAINDSILGLVTYQRTEAYDDVNASSTKLFEFAAAGLPVLATPTKPSQKMIAQAASGLVTQGFDSESIYSGILESTTSKELWTKWSLSGRNWSQQNGSWSQSEKRLLDLYALLSTRIS